MNNYNVLYKLEHHLEDICQSNLEYSNLLSTWSINKKTIADLLKNISQNYPHFTDHSELHSKSIISNIEMLLGEENIRKLSPSDTWMLLQAAYIHDLGMVLMFSEIEKGWNSSEFSEYLSNLQESKDKDLQIAAKYILDLPERFRNGDVEVDWPLNVRHYVPHIVASYYRSKHAIISKKYIDDLANKWNLNLTFNHLIPERIIYLLGEISYSHNVDTSYILEMDYITNGYNSDYIHPRFVAEMLRMGDLLDIDNNRFNPYIEKVVGDYPHSSKVHEQKHLSTKHILITPSEIEFKADCPDAEVYRETRNFLHWLQIETDFLAKYWHDIMPREITGSAPILRKKNISLNGKPDNGLADLRFNISQEKAFEIIEGSNIYSDKYVIIRELIQNSMDALKIQMWIDIKNHKYDPWLQLNGQNIEDIAPFDIDRNIYSNYKINVSILDYDQDNIEVIVQDNGIGITIEQLKNICNVGHSNSIDREKSMIINGMPNWLRPTAGFGVGLQSIFLITDKFTIVSKTNSGEITATIGSRKLDDYIQVYSSNDMESNGTVIKFLVKKENNFQFKLTGELSHYIREEYDPFGDNKMIYFKIYDVLLEHCRNSFYDIFVEFPNHQRRVLPISKLGCFCNKKDNYYYDFNLDTYEMDVWDRKNSILLKFNLCNSNHFSQKLMFKGIDLSSSMCILFHGLSYKCDIYGFDTKSSITLNRENLKSEARLKINEIIIAAKNFYIDYLFNNITPSKIENQNLLFSFLQLCSQQQINNLIKKNENWQKVLENKEIPSISFDENGKEVEGTNNLYEILNNLSDFYFVYNRRDFEDNNFYDKESTDILKNIKSILLKNTEKIKNMVIIDDPWLIKLLTSFYKSKLKILLSEDNHLLLVNCTYEDNLVLNLDLFSKKILLDVRDTCKFKLFKNSFYNTKRKYIPAFNEYSKLATNRQFGLSGLDIKTVRLIIFPISKDEYNDIQLMNKEEFILKITSDNKFKNLCQYISKNSAFCKEITVEEVEQEYIKLLDEIYTFSKDETRMN